MSDNSALPVIAGELLENLPRRRVLQGFSCAGSHECHRKFLLQRPHLVKYPSRCRNSHRHSGLHLAIGVVAPATHHSLAESSASNTRW